MHYVLMELITAKVAEALKTKSELWTIEFTDLSAHQAFMGYSLTSKYILVGITSPLQNSQVSINSIPENEGEELVIPINLENSDPSAVGHICFKGVENITQKWDIYFFDRRFDDCIKVDSSNLILVKKDTKNTRGEQLRLIGYTKKDQNQNCFFELQLKPKNYIK